MKTVLIDPNGVVDSRDRIVGVSKRGHEDVRWVAVANGGPWKIKFDKGDGSPFSQTEYDVAQGGSHSSTGGPVGGVVGRTYRYSVFNAGGTVTDDPDVDIES